MDKLQGVHPDLQVRVPKIIQAMAVLGYEMRVTDGVRTQDEQQELYAQGRTTPGPDVSFKRPLGRTVTNADGLSRRSNHQPVQGFGKAVDCTFWIGGIPSWADDLPWELYGAMAKALGLKWGGDWKSPDRPHIELP
jgi:peptidoglycan L-alanyl-D-glutamate endopeptidase CwlK